jgi:hypothetical protein
MFRQLSGWRTEFRHAVFGRSDCAGKSAIADLDAVKFDLRAGNCRASCGAFCQ